MQALSLRKLKGFLIQLYSSTCLTGTMNSSPVLSYRQYNLSFQFRFEGSCSGNNIHLPIHRNIHENQIWPKPAGLLPELCAGGRMMPCGAGSPQMKQTAPASIHRSSKLMGPPIDISAVSDQESLRR
jgi:hypothetical protein